MILAHVEAFLNVLRYIQPPLNVYDQDKVPQLTSRASLPDSAYPYCVVWDFGLRGMGPRRLDDRSATRAFRVVTMYVGTTASEARLVEDDVTRAVEGYRLTVNGYLCTPCHWEAGRSISRDPSVEDLYSGTAAWTFVSTEQIAA